MSLPGCGVGPNNQFDVDDLSTWILRRLGAPLLKVELTEEHLRDCIAMGLRWYAAKKGFIKTYKQQLTPGTTEYPLPDDVNIVTDVVFPLTTYDLTPITSPWGWAWPSENLGMPLNGVYNGFGRSGGQTLGVVSTFYQAMQYSETARRVLNGELEWRQEDRLLYIMPRSEANYYPQAIVYYAANSFNILDLNQRDFDLVRRYALAKAKRDLGRIRSKYSELPGAQGSVGLDGERLLSEADQEEQVLEEEIGQSAMPIGFLTGALVAGLVSWVLSSWGGGLV
jgi:hypothetical protein